MRLKNTVLKILFDLYVKFINMLLLCILTIGYFCVKLKCILSYRVIIYPHSAKPENNVKRIFSLFQLKHLLISDSIDPSITKY